MANFVFEDAELQSVDFGFDLDEFAFDLSVSEEKASEDDAQEALVFTELSDYEILDDVTDDLDDLDDSDGSDAEDGEEMISPIEAGENLVTEDIEVESEETTQFDEEEPESLDDLALSLDDDAFALLADVSDEDTSDEGSSDEDPEEEEILTEGTDSADVIICSSSRDFILAYGGDDYLDGGEGNDVIVNRSGNAILIGGSGNDELNGGLGNDILYGGAGDDLYKWVRGDGDDLVIEEGQSRNNIFELEGVAEDQVQLKELENGDWQLIIAATSPKHNDGGVITFQAGSMAAFAAFKFYDPSSDDDPYFDTDWESNNTDFDSSVCCG